MNKKYHILFGIFLLWLAGSCFQSCREEEFGETIPDRETLIAQGRYITARNTETASVTSGLDKSTWFPVGTLYRLLAFSKAYTEGDNSGDTPAATHPRFNKVAWEGETGGLRFINVKDSPEKWFGFSPINGEEKGKDNLVSLDFYGFTYGEKKDQTLNYIELEGLEGETTPDENSLKTLRHKEDVNDNKLNDLYWGHLPNQNIATAGGSTEVASQSVLPFRHCFSKLHFQVVQQAKENNDEAEGCFGDISLEKIEVTGTYTQGYVYLSDGTVKLSGKKESRPLNINKPVTTKQVEVGSMIVYPSDGSGLKDRGDGYQVGLKITVKCPDEATQKKFEAGNPSDKIKSEVKNGDRYITITLDNIPNNEETNAPLYFKQNTEYTLVISFQEDAVRIITVTPQVWDWIPGEGTETDPWQEQAIGQPQMFDNIVWSDRNLGSDHYDPTGENFEKTIGYFYQSGRNIPYYPFDSEKYYDENTKKFTSHPNPWDKSNSVLANVKPYSTTRHRFYPIVDEEILLMLHQMEGWGTVNGNSGNDRTWIIDCKSQPQMFIPETKPTTNVYFDFMRSKDENHSGLSYNNKSLGEEQSYDMKWNEGQQNQPVTGSWIIPSSNNFMTIFPSTPHAGNITFRGGGNNTTPMQWGDNTNNMKNNPTTLRVTVPYYYENMSKPTGRSDNYLKAWNTLKENNDAGTTKIDAYTNGAPNSNNNIEAEPDGDPEDGYASVYVISRAEEENLKDKSKCSLPAGYDQKKFVIGEWGTIYAIKRVYTPKAYRMRWRVICAGLYGTEKTPGLYIEICRYRCNATDHLNETNYNTKYDWDHPAARLYFPICGLGDWTGNYINFGTECQYATSDKIIDGKTSAVQIKITGDNAYNTYMAVIRKAYVNRDFGKQIRPIEIGNK